MSREENFANNWSHSGSFLMTLFPRDFLNLSKNVLSSRKSETKCVAPMTERFVALKKRPNERNFIFSKVQKVLKQVVEIPLKYWLKCTVWNRPEKRPLCRGIGHQLVLLVDEPWHVQGDCTVGVGLSFCPHHFTKTFWTNLFHKPYN